MLARLQWAKRGLQPGIEIHNEDRLAPGLRSVLYDFTNDALDFQVADLSVAGNVEFLYGPDRRIDVRHAGARNLVHLRMVAHVRQQLAQALFGPAQLRVAPARAKEDAVL